MLILVKLQASHINPVHRKNLKSAKNDYRPFIYFFERNYV